MREREREVKVNNVKYHHIAIHKELKSITGNPDIIFAEVGRVVKG